jgi:ammonium transporter, Amt family
MIYGACIGTFMYPVFGNWVWGGGWLAQMGVNWGIGHGHVDFAGSSVVHMQGGVICLIFCWLIGPRYGKYDSSGKIVNPIIPHSIPLVMLGTFILAFGWFGFNPGSSLAATDLRIAVVAVNTMLASATGAVGATLWMWWFKTKKPDPAMMCNGMLAGLVAITCPCAFVSAWGAVALGLVSGILVVESVFFFDKIGIDDCVGAISVHGVNGAWGCLSLGLFADGTYGDGWNGVSGKVTGLFYGGGWGQLEAEAIGITVCFITLSVLSIIAYKIAEVLVGNRVSKEVEIAGLDMPEMGAPGYSGFVMDKATETPVS